MEKITCSRCRGKGITNNAPVYAGVPGGCYKCQCRGWVYKDKFDEYFIGTVGDFYGFSREIKARGVVSKSIGRLTPGDRLCTTSDTKVTVITEEQARKFFARYGDRTEVAS